MMCAAPEGGATHPWVDLARSVKHRLAVNMERSARASVDMLRRGSRTILTPPDGGLRFGNLLYLWLQAHRRTLAGSPTLVRQVPAMDPWLDVFPALRFTTTSVDGIRFSDRRAWDPSWLYQRFGIDFTRAELDTFVFEALAPHVAPLDDAEAVVVNIRRGDYYTHFADKYSFDQVRYVDAALDRIGATPHVVVVSDDPEWCRRHLDPLLRAYAESIEYAEPDPVQNFRTLAGARRIVGTNSTFSYWGAYTASALNVDARIVMPEFHGRMEHGTAAHQLDPSWIALPGFD